VTFALKALYGAGLFADVKINFDVAKVDGYESRWSRTDHHQVDFEGNDKVSQKDLERKSQLKPRMVFTRSKVQADVQRNHRAVSPQRQIRGIGRIRSHPAAAEPGRPDLRLAEGPSTGVSRINFIGKPRLQRLRAEGHDAPPRESDWYRFLATNDNYDPDRLTFDREQLRAATYISPWLCRLQTSSRRWPS